MTRLKILAAIPSSFCFGLQHVSIDLFAASKKDVDVHFLVTRWNNGEFISLLEKHDFAYTESWLGMFSRKLDWRNVKMSVHALSKMPRLYFDFIRLRRRLKPDIIYFANHHELILLLPLLRILPGKVVCHMHDPPPAIAFQKKTFARYGSRVDKFIAISEDVKRRLIALDCPSEKIVVVHNGIHQPEVVTTTLDFRSQFSWPSDAFVVGITGQMTPTKGHEDVLAAVAKVISQNENIRLLIGGKKLEPLYSALQQEIKRLGLVDRVGFSGWLGDVADFYRNIDLFILGSRHDEGYGLVVAEAMAHGKPAIITRSGGAVEIVEDGISGFIVEKRDVDRITEKILLVSQDEKLYRKLSLNAMSRISAEFTIENASTGFVKALREV